MIDTTYSARRLWYVSHEAADAAIANAATSSPSTSRVECLSKEVMEEADRLTRAVRVRSREVEEAFVVDPTLRFSRDERY